jgi:hypothetical protein
MIVPTKVAEALVKGTAHIQNTNRSPVPQVKQLLSYTTPWYGPVLTGIHNKRTPGSTFGKGAPKTFLYSRVGAWLSCSQ